MCKQYIVINILPIIVFAVICDEAIYEQEILSINNFVICVGV